MTNQHDDIITLLLTGEKLKNIFIEISSKNPLDILLYQNSIHEFIIWNDK